MLRLNLIRFGMALERTSRKAKIYKPATYQAIPYYQKPIYIDPHDTYTKRSKDEVLTELRQREFEI